MITREWAFSVTPGRHICPQCNGGSTRERSCNVFDLTDRHVKCHRASCGAFAKYPLYPGSGSIGNALHVTAPEVLQPYTGRTLSPSDVELEYWEQRYGFEAPLPVQSNRAYTYLLPIMDPSRSPRGTMQMQIRPKVRRIWKAKAEPMLHWSLGGDNYDGVYLVEDWVSAEKLWDVASIRAVALLGTDLNAAKVAEIQAHARHVTIALDADATAKAFLLARKWGLAFETCRVQILTQDIKDMSIKDIQGMTRNAGHSATRGLSEF